MEQQDKIIHAKKVISTIAAKSNRAILFYSSGKDSLAMLELMHKEFDEIVLVFMYFVRDLEHINKYLKYSVEKYPNVRVLQVPHWNLSYIWRLGTFCKPNPNIKLVTLKDIDKAVKEKTGIEYSFFGMKKSDSLSRRIMLGRYELEAISPTNCIYPLSFWNQSDVVEYNKTMNLPTPISYTLGKKSQGLWFNPDCYLYLQKHYPNDLKKILKEYPLSEKILIDYKNKLKNGKGS